MGARFVELDLMVITPAGAAGMRATMARVSDLDIVFALLAVTQGMTRDIAPRIGHIVRASTTNTMTEITDQGSPMIIIDPTHLPMWCLLTQANHRPQGGGQQIFSTGLAHEPVIVMIIVMITTPAGRGNNAMGRLALLNRIRIRGAMDQTVAPDQVALPTAASMVTHEAWLLMTIGMLDNITIITTGGAGLDPCCSGFCTPSILSQLALKAFHRRVEISQNATRETTRYSSQQCGPVYRP